MTSKKFCKYQVKCKEDTKSTWTCTAHMHEGMAFECPYTSFNEAKAMYHDWDGNITKYRCEDAEKVE